MKIIVSCSPNYHHHCYYLFKLQVAAQLFCALCGSLAHSCVPGIKKQKQNQDLYVDWSIINYLSCDISVLLFVLFLIVQTCERVIKSCPLPLLPDRRVLRRTGSSSTALLVSRTLFASVSFILWLTTVDIKFLHKYNKSVEDNRK